MKKLLVAILAVSLLSLSATASNDGGKKKARKKANIECKKDNACDPKNCDLKNCQYPSDSKDGKCSASPACSNNK